jgi:Fe-S-cluster-containing hydrogenase component 2
VNDETGAVIVDKEQCTACGQCIQACPGRIPHIHPTEKYAVICDLCGGDPQCAKVCEEGRWNVLWVVPKPPSGSYKLYARRPKEITEDLAENLYGEYGKELV